MRAMILAAGRGSRMRHLSDTRPKALAVVAGKTLLERAVEYLLAQGVEEMLVNVHHQAGQMMEAVKELRSRGVPLEISDERDRLLDTGGGMRKAAEWLAASDPFVVYNVDILTDMPLEILTGVHREQQNTATLAVRERGGSRVFLLDRDGYLCGWKDRRSGKKRLGRVAEVEAELSYSGFFVAGRDFLQEMERKEEVFSLRGYFLELSARYPIGTCRHQEGYWLTVGSPEQLAGAEAFLSDQNHNKLIRP